MMSVTPPRMPLVRNCEAQTAKVGGNAPEPPDDLIQLGEAIQSAFERLAHEAPDSVMRAVYLDMAAGYRQANKAADHRWRDVTG